MSQQTTPSGAYTPKRPFDPVQASDPSGTGMAMAPGAAARGRVPTSDSLRRVIDEVLKGDADLDAFCHDHHDDVYRRFSDGMERGRKITLLLKHAPRAAILASLYGGPYRATMEQHEHLLVGSPATLAPLSWVQTRPRLLATGLLGLLAITVAAWRAWTTYTAIEPFAPQNCGIVLGGPGITTDAGKKLCEELRSRHGAGAVRCPPPPGMPALFAAPLDWAARKSGAVLLTEIDDTGQAKLTPLGRLAAAPLFGWQLDLNIGITAESDRKRAGIAISALAHLGAQQEGFVADDVKCPVDATTPKIDSIALLTLLVVPSCGKARIDSRKLECSDGTTVSDETCALARYIDAELNLADTGRIRGNLEDLVANGAPRFRTVAKLLLALIDCKESKLPAAATRLRELAEGADACVLARITATAACVASSAEFGALDHEIAEEIMGLEARPIDRKEECPKRLRAQALADRGYWREQRRQWDDALADYQKAWDLFQDPLYGLNLAEVWLKKDQSKEAAKLLDVKCDAGEEPNCTARVALLRWITAGNTLARELAKDTLLPPDEQPRSKKVIVLGPPGDELLRELICGRTSSADCLYDVLMRRSTRDDLLKAFEAAERSHPLGR